MTARSVNDKGLANQSIKKWGLPLSRRNDVTRDSPVSNMARWSKAGEIWFLVWNFLKIYLIAIWCLIEQLMAKHRIPNGMGYMNATSGRSII